VFLYKARANLKSINSLNFNRIKSYQSRVDSLNEVIKANKFVIDSISREQKEYKDNLKQYMASALEYKQKLTKEKSRNKSVEVRTGQIMEVMAPFLELFKYDPKKANFLGNPIDYIIFNDDEIVFVEIKSGKSKLSKKQNNIKKVIENGNVRFELVRFDWDNK